MYYYYFTIVFLSHEYLVYVDLQFATNAKKIKNKPIVNEIISGETMLKKYRNQIKDLESQLEKVCEYFYFTVTT